MKLRIDNQEVTASAGTTVLDAARSIGIEIPTLCHLPGKPAQTSCMVCLVKVHGRPRLMPACATICEDGMRVESETEDIQDARRTAVELLLAEHLGDCVAPCQGGSPSGLAIPKMLRQVSAGDLPGAMATILESVALPGTLTRIEDEPGEKPCRRALKDSSVAIGAIIQHVADAMAEQRAQAGPESGKRVAVVGAGAAGLTAAWTLRRMGHRCTIFESARGAGGKLRNVSTSVLAPHVLEAEVQRIVDLGADIQCDSPIDTKKLEGLRGDFDAVIVASGGGTAMPDKAPDVFAAGAIARGGMSATRAAADGRAAAVRTDQFLHGKEPLGPQRPFSTHMGKLLEGELATFLTGSNPARRWAGEGDRRVLTGRQAATEADRCLHCDCRKADTCRLRDVSQAMDAAVRRFSLPRRKFEQCGRDGAVVYEPGKCIKCGLCVAITREAGEELGLAFVGRGFDVRVTVPFNRSLEDALQKVARECVQACPTGALAENRA